MPVINVGVDRLVARLGRAYAVADLVVHLEDLGCDVDGVAEVATAICPRCRAAVESAAGDEPPKRCAYCGHEAATAFEVVGRRESIKLDLQPSRPDLFDTIGLARALRGLLGLESGLPKYKVKAGTLAVLTDPGLVLPDAFRPHIACASLSIPPLSEEDLRDLMKLQESLHWAIGRDRKLASIGVYDATAIAGPILYRAALPDEVSFAPLGYPDRPMTLGEILREHPKGKAYAWLLASHTRYPVLMDADGQVLSMPPIINGESTRVRAGATELFVDVTGTTAIDVERALSVLVGSLAELGGTVRTVEVADTTGAVRTTPDLAPRSIEVDRERCNAWLGLELSAKEFSARAKKMRLGVTGGPTVFTVSYGAYRSDVKHPVDLYEDIAIGHGLRNFSLALVPTATVGRERLEERLSERARRTMAGLGYDEVMTLYQTTEAAFFTKMRRPVGTDHVAIANPKAADFTVVRSELVPGLLGLLEHNRKKPMPLRLFETSNVVLLDPEAETGTAEWRRLALAVMGPDAGYAEVRAALDALLFELGLTGTYTREEHPSYLQGRVAGVDLGEGRRARVGELHPEVLLAWNLPAPVAVAELDLARVI